MTASGVSSTIRSTPVACSRARMLRPSRPMMRPFMSSLGKRHDRDGRFGDVVDGDALDGRCQDLAGRDGRFGLRFLLELVDPAVEHVAHFRSTRSIRDVARLVSRQNRNSLQFFVLPSFVGIQLGPASIKLFFLALEIFVAAFDLLVLAVELFFFLLDPAFNPVQIFAGV